MSEIITNWTKEEFKAYLLLYAAQSDMVETSEEKTTILSMVPQETYERIHKEIDMDNDYQSIQKIIYNLEKYQYDKDGLAMLISDIRSVFMADGHMDIMEKNMMRVLSKLMSE